MMNTWLIVIGIIVVLFVSLVVVASRRSEESEEDTLAARLAELSSEGTPESLEQVELSLPFYNRVIIPILKKLGDLSTRFTPQHALDSTAKKIELAGNPGNIGAASFLSMRFISAAFFGALLFVIFLGTSTWPVSREILVTILFIVLGFFFPQLWLQSKIERRQKEIRKGLPDALDLLTICVEAGLGFDAAMSKVGDKWENEISLSFARALREIQLGKARREALKIMAGRIDLPEMTSFVAAIIQSEVLGVSMARVLRIQSDQMRIKRKQRAEEEAEKAPVKMILPMGLFIFPSILIVLLTPALMRIISTFGDI
ncbi:type II secretion system F family protein [Chloroflexota bacterium]